MVKTRVDVVRTIFIFLAILNSNALVADTSFSHFAIVAFGAIKLITNDIRSLAFFAFLYASFYSLAPPFCFSTLPVFFKLLLIGERHRYCRDGQAK